MCRSGINRAARLIAAVAAVAGLGSVLAGCSDDYWNRRETIGLSAGDAIAGSGDKNIAFNGEKMQSAVQRYRTGKVTTPVDPEDFESTNQASQSVTTTVNTGAPPASTATPAQ
jgi:hypothetical protein